MVKVNKYIFLDIDGVLNCIAWFEQNKNKSGYTEINPEKVKLLKEIVDKTGAEIILSSTWRELAAHDGKPDHPMYTYLVNSLKQFGLYIKDHTPRIQENRPQEIKAWLEKNTGYGEYTFVSLDDDFPKKEYEKYGIGKCLIKTDFYGVNGGLQREHVNKAIQILNRCI